MDSQLRVCFVAGTLGLGGAERQLYYMVKTLTEHGVACQVLCLTKGEKYEARITALGIQVIWVGQSENRLRRLRRIILEIRKWKPDIIQSAHSYTSLYAMIAGKLFGIPSITAVRSHGTKAFAELGILGRLSLVLSNSIAANSRHALDIISKRFPHKKYIYLQNVVDCNVFSPYPAANSQRNSITRLLTVGRLIDEKRHDIFLNVLALVKACNPSLKATIVGDGLFHDNLVAQANALQIQNEVEFVGAVEQVVDYYKNANIFVLTSDYEGTPNVILEAMACGLPIVSTRAGGAIDLVLDGETGFLADCGDVETLAQYIIRLVDDEELRHNMGQAARKRAVTYYGLDSLYEELIAIYQQLLQQ